MLKNWLALTPIEIEIAIIFCGQSGDRTRWLDLRQHPEFFQQQTPNLIRLLQDEAPDGTLAGTTLPLLVGVENLVNWGICGVGEAIALATESPRKAIGLTGIAVGQPAQLLRWHWDEGTSKLSWQRWESLNEEC